MTADKNNKKEEDVKNVKIIRVDVGTPDFFTEEQGVENIPAFNTLSKEVSIEL